MTKLEQMVKRVHVGSFEIFHHLMLLGEERISKVEARQKETRLTGNASKEFLEKSFWM